MDVIFKSQPNMVTDLGEHAFLRSNCLHQNIYVKLEFKYFIYHFKHVNSGYIKRTINILGWKYSINNLDANDQVLFFNSIIKNIIFFSQ